MKNIKIYRYQRGNHSLDHIIAHGNVIFEGNIKQTKDEISSLKKQATNKWHNTSTDDSLADFVAYELGDLWVIDMNAVHMHSVMQEQSIDDGETINPKNNTIMEQKKENKTYVGSSYKTEFDDNGIVTGITYNLEVNIDKIEEAIPDLYKKKEIILNIEKRVSPHQKEDVDGNKVDVPLEKEAKMPGYNVYIGDMHNSHRELAVFLKTENLMSKLPVDEYGNVKITAASRTTKGFDMSSFMVYENPGKNAEKVIGENGKIVRNFIGRGYSAAENFGNDKNNNIIGTANKFIFNDKETEQRTGKAYNLAIDPDKINSLKVNEYGQAKVALIPITETGVNEKGDAVEKKYYIIAEKQSGQKDVEAHLQLNIARTELTSKWKNDITILSDLTPRMSSAKENPKLTIYLVADDRKKESIGNNNADLNVYESIYEQGMNREERIQTQKVKKYVGEGWTRVPAEMKLDPSDLTPEGIDKAIDKKDYVRITAIAFRKNNLITPEVQAKAATLQNKQVDGAIKYAIEKAQKQASLDELHKKVVKSNDKLHNPRIPKHSM